MNYYDRKIHNDHDDINSQYYNITIWVIMIQYTLIQPITGYNATACTYGDNIGAI